MGYCRITSWANYELNLPTLWILYFVSCILGKFPTATDWCERRHRSRWLGRVMWEKICTEYVRLIMSAFNQHGQVFATQFCRGNQPFSADTSDALRSQSSQHEAYLSLKTHCSRDANFPQQPKQNRQTSVSQSMCQGDQKKDTNSATIFLHRAGSTHGGMAAFRWLLLLRLGSATFFPRVPFEKSHLNPEAYWVDTPSGPTRLCFHKGDISFDLCCDQRFGERGNEECWDSFDTYEESLGLCTSCGCTKLSFLQKSHLSSAGKLMNKLQDSDIFFWNSVTLQK